MTKLGDRLYIVTFSYVFILGARQAEARSLKVKTKVENILVI